MARQIVTVPTSTLYEAWAPTYDTDGNVLQLVDTAAFTARVPFLIPSTPIRVLDLGCGTGRNTYRLLPLLAEGSSIHAVDFSAAMLSQARLKLPSHHPSVSVTFNQADISDPSALLQILNGEKVDLVVSTLVIEHLPLSVFFSAVAAVLKPGGHAWVSDMHPEMGTSKAGFNVQDVKTVGGSWHHGIKETMEAAKEVGLEVEGKVEENGVEGVSAERAEKWVGRKILVGYVFKMEGGDGVSEKFVAEDL